MGMPDNNDDIPDESAKKKYTIADDEVEGNLNECEISQDKEEQQQQPDRRSENMNRLSQSTRQLSSAITSWGTSVDEKLKVSENAKKVDEKTQISSTTRRGWNTLTNWYSSSGLGDKTKQATAVLTSSVKKLDEKLHISETASGA